MKAIEVAVIDHATPVDFETEILPILASNCLACHNKSKPKAGLVLETPAEILKGGDTGAAVIAGKAIDSLMLKAAAHQIADTRMPPAGNKVAAADLTPQQLGLLKLWIDQGASGQVRASAKVRWQAIAESWNPIYAVALTADGDYAACGRANRIVVYHIPTGRAVAQLSDPALGGAGVAHNDVVNAIAFSPDGHHLASGGYREIKLWRREAPGQVAKLGDGIGDSTASSIARSSDGSTIAIGSRSGAIRLFNASTGAVLSTLEGHTSSVDVICYSTDDKRLASGSADKSVRVWDLASRKEIAQTDLPEAAKALAFAGGGGGKVAVGYAKTVRIFTVPDTVGELMQAKEFPAQPDAIVTLAPMPQPAQMLCATADGSLRTCDIENGRTIRQMTHGGPIVAAALSDDGRTVASAGVDKVIRLFKTEKGEKLAEIRGDASRIKIAAAAGRIASIAKAEATYLKVRREELEKQTNELTDRARKSADEFVAATKALSAKEQAVKETEDVKKKAEDEKQGGDKLRSAEQALLEAQKDLERFTAAKRSAEVGSTLAAAASEKSAKALADAGLALSSAEESRKRREDAATAAVKAAEQDSIIRAIAFSPGGLLLGAIDAEGAVHTWSAGGPLPGIGLETVQGPKNATGIAVAERDRVVVTQADAPATIWDVEPHWELERKLGTDLPDAASPSLAVQSNGSARPIDPTALADRVNALAYSPDGNFLASGGGVPSRAGELRIWDLSTGAVKYALDEIHTDTILALDYSSDGSFLATGSSDRFVKVIDVESGRLMKSFEGHSHHVLGVAWRRGRHTLASSSADNTVRVWDFDSGELKKTVSGYDKEVAALSFVGETEQILTCGGEGRVRIIKADGSEVRNFSGAADFVFAAAASFDGSLIAAGGQDGILRVWNGSNGTLLETFAPKSVGSR